MRFILYKKGQSLQAINRGHPSLSLDTLVRNEILGSPERIAQKKWKRFHMIGREEEGGDCFRRHWFNTRTWGAWRKNIQVK